MKTLKPLAASWGRSFLSAALATYVVVGFDAEALLYSGLAAIIPMIMRYLNPKDSAFGVKKQNGYHRMDGGYSMRNSDSNCRLFDDEIYYESHTYRASSEWWSFS